MINIISEETVIKYNEEYDDELTTAEANEQAYEQAMFAATDLQEQIEELVSDFYYSQLEFYDRPDDELLSFGQFKKLVKSL